MMLSMSCGTKKGRGLLQEVPMSIRTSSFRSIVLSSCAAMAVVGLGATSAIASPKPAVTAEAPAPADTDAKTTKARDSRTYCRRFNLSGSRVERKKCLTRDEWAVRGVDVDSSES